VLFDLRSRGRRRTVQVVYIGLAVLIGAGLVLFGVGTGSSGGGLFGAFTGGGASNSGNAYVQKQVTKAEAKTKADPSSAAAWAALVQARYSAANSGLSSSGTYSAAGLTQLRGVTQAYVHYAKLDKSPGADTATFAAHAYGQLKEYAQAANTWQAVVSASPGSIRGLECTTMMSYAAGNTNVAALAEAATLKKFPKARRKTIKTELESAKKTKSVAVESC
jgi:hypothetical protein